MILESNGLKFMVHDREDWQVPSRPVTGPPPTPDLVHHVVIHWPGASPNWRPPKTTAESAAHLRWSQDMYLSDPARGYSYGYAFVIGQTPIDWSADVVIFDVWEVRGMDIRPAANNGDKGIFADYERPNFNGRSIPIQLTASVAHPATDDQIEQARHMIAALDRRYGERLTVIPHRTSDSTTCPESYIVSKLPLIETRPVWTEPAPTPPAEPTEWVDVKIGDRSERVAQVQYALTSKGFRPVGGVDSIYGLQTAAAVNEFQKSRALPVNGSVVDVHTAQALGFNVKLPVPPPPPTGGSIYTVVQGDGWYKIANKVGVMSGDLLTANDATLTTPLRPGQKLKVPPPTRSYTVMPRNGLWHIATGLGMPTNEQSYERLLIQLEHKYGRRTPHAGDVLTL